MTENGAFKSVPGKKKKWGGEEESPERHIDAPLFRLLEHYSERMAPAWMRPYSQVNRLYDGTV